jgi:hypothetical protein
MWTDNGNKLSNQYAGTDTNNSGVVETDSVGIGGTLSKMFTGVKRYIVNTFTDMDKQESIKLFLKKHPSQTLYGIRESLNKELLKRINDF